MRFLPTVESGPGAFSRFRGIFLIGDQMNDMCSTGSCRMQERISGIFLAKFFVMFVEVLLVVRQDFSGLTFDIFPNF